MGEQNRKNGEGWWVEETVTPQQALSSITDDVELVVDLDALPVSKPEMAEYELLPAPLVHGWYTSGLDRDRDRKRESFPACDRGRDGQHDRRVASAGEAHKTRRG